MTDDVIVVCLMCLIGLALAWLGKDNETGTQTAVGLLVAGFTAMTLVLLGILQLTGI